MITREFNLYLHAGHSIPLVINVNQYDRGEQWLFTLFNADGTQYVPSSGAIVGIKSDNLGIINSGTVDSQGRVVISETQQMTAAVGKAVFELLIDDQTHGTANFIVLVEPKPGDNADLSESDYSLFQQAIDGTSATAIAEGVADWMDENLTPTTPVVDASLTVQGAAADAKKTGDEISALKSQIEQSGGLTSAIKSALLQLAQKVTYIDDDGQRYYNDLYDALYPPIVYTAITLNKSSLPFGSLNTTQTLVATTTPSGGNVTWSSSNTSVATVSQTGVVTSVGYGNATITATCGSLTAQCSVAIAQATVTSISASYTQSETVYPNTPLNDLKNGLVVTALWSNGTTSTVAKADYTVSGTLTEETSTITVAYGGKTTTFNVTVSTRTTISVESGAINYGNGNEEANVKRARTDYIPATNNVFKVSAYANSDSTNTVSYAIRYYDANHTFIGTSDAHDTIPTATGSGGHYLVGSWLAGDGTEYTDNSTLTGVMAYIRLVFRDTSESTITDVSGIITVDGNEYAFVYE